jgi:hypothetical protein
MNTPVSAVHDRLTAAEIVFGFLTLITLIGCAWLV